MLRDPYVCAFVSYRLLGIAVWAAKIEKLPASRVESVGEVIVTDLFGGDRDRISQALTAFGGDPAVSSPASNP